MDEDIQPAIIVSSLKQVHSSELYRPTTAFLFSSAIQGLYRVPQTILPRVLNGLSHLGLSSAARSAHAAALHQTNSAVKPLLVINDTGCQLQAFNLNSPSVSAMTMSPCSGFSALSTTIRSPECKPISFIESPIALTKNVAAGRRIQ